MLNSYDIKPLFEKWLRSIKNSLSFRSVFLKSDIKFPLTSCNTKKKNPPNQYLSKFNKENKNTRIRWKLVQS